LPELLDAAKGGDEAAFRRLVEPHRRELHAHCYRMLGSVHDAEDALQEAMLRAWRGLERFASPEARYEMRESVELAFIAALQHLPPNQRAALILREVLGFSAKEAAEALGTSVASVNSALQRARVTVEQRLPERSQQSTLRDLGDEEVGALVERYLQAWERNDVEAVVSMLSTDAAFAMPPLRSWFGGSEAIRAFLTGWPLSGQWRWRALRARASGQEALAFYSFDPEAGNYQRFALNVLSFRGAEIAEVDAFLTRTTEDPDRRVLARLPEQSFDPRRLELAFERLGLPEELAA
jgi:RNA polymerase sigma-70 factor, ECF subfamily